MKNETSKAQQVMERGWGGALTHEKVGQILALADEAGGGDKWDEALKFISGCRRQEEIENFMDELAALVNIQESLTK
jgi:hypothetical protein